MQKSLFSRYFTLCASITLASIALMEILISALSANYFSREQLESLELRARQSAQYVARNYEANDRRYVEAEVLSRSFEIMSSFSGADILLTDTSGTVVYAVSFSGEDTSSRERMDLVGSSVPENALEKVSTNGVYSKMGRFGSFAKGSVFAVGTPVVSGEDTIAIVYILSPITEFSEYMRELFKIFLIGACLALLVCFWILYYSTEELVRPLRAMAGAANAFAKGDFSARVAEQGEEEIVELARSFNQMAESLAGKEMSSRAFVANVSHELKTPMMTIGGFIDGILDGTIPEDKSRHYLRIVSDEVKRLSRMVVSMLNISRIEAGEMTIVPQQVDLNEIVCRTVIGFERRIEEKHIEVEGLDAGRLYVEADPDLVSQIVYNLIENAVKFTDEGGVISVSYQTDSKMVLTAVRNTGAGIPPEELSRLFDRFYKSDRSRSQDKSGVGLGLHIVRSLVRLHGGTVNVTSTEGEYTECTFTLPLYIQKNKPALFRKTEKSADGPN